MTMRDGPRPDPTTAQRGRLRPPSEGDPGVAGNERLTALAGMVLLVLILVELVTVVNVRAQLSVHVIVGLLLAGPLAVKLGSTGYRFLRYYTESPAFVRKGPPHPALRVLAPLLVATTLVLVGSGIGLLATDPAHPGPLLPVHNIGFVVWLPLIAIHVVAYVRQAPRLTADDLRGRPLEQASGRGLRLGVNLAALILGAVAAVILLPVAAPWSAWITTTEQGLPGPVIAGTVVASLALLAARPVRWT